MCENLLKSILENHKNPKFEKKPSELFPFSNDLNRLETELLTTRNSIQHDLRKLEKLNSKLHLLQQQNEIYSHESQVILEKIKDANWAFTKEVCLQIGKIKKPTPELEDLCEKFLLLLDQKERNWKLFQAVARNYELIKGLMNTFNVENISEENIDLLLPLWKNYNTISPILQKQCKGGYVLLDWITGWVEYKIKKATYNTIKRNIIEIQAKIKDQLSILAEKNSAILTIEAKITELKNSNIRKNLIEDKKNLNESPSIHPLERHKSFSFNDKNVTLLRENPNDDPLHQEYSKINNMITPLKFEKKSPMKGINRGDTNGDDNISNDINDGECNLSKDLRCDTVIINNVVNDVYDFSIKKKMSINNMQMSFQQGVGDWGGDGKIQQQQQQQAQSCLNSPRHIQKIHNIIKANDPRNSKEVLIMNSKLMFAKETQQQYQQHQQLHTFGVDLKLDNSKNKSQAAQDEINFAFMEESSNQNRPKPEESNGLIRKSNSISSPNSHRVSIHSCKSDETLGKSQKMHFNYADYHAFQESLKMRMENNIETGNMKNKIVEYQSQVQDNDESNDDIGCVRKGIKLFCS